MAKLTNKQPSLKKMQPRKAVQVSRLQKILGSFFFARLYLSLAALILILSTLFWSLVGARVQSGNADQLVDSYLFKGSATFHGAQFPASHSFLLKWPLFWLGRIFNYSPWIFTTITVGLAVITVGALAIILWRIERRPLLLGTLLLALASVLMLVPAAPYAGSLLPVNMAMITTRNIEYIVFIASIVMFLKSKSLKQWHFWLATSLLALLVASDKLFLTIAIGGGLITCGFYLVRRRTLAMSAGKWLALSVTAGMVGIATLAILNATHTTHIVNQTGASPYGAVHSLHGLLLAGIYGILGLFTNFGANPAYDANVLRNIPHQTYVRLTAPGGISYIINFLLFIIGFTLVAQLLVAHNKRLPRTKMKLKSMLFANDIPAQLTVILIAASLVAIAVFVATNHYYPVDARYETISLFAIFIASATYLRSQKFSEKTLVLSGIILLISIAAAVPAVIQTQKDNDQALTSVTTRNKVVSQVLARHHVSTLVGDYWRVLPIRQTAGATTLNVMPLQSCNAVRNTLSSTAWQPDLHKNSFAYLLSFDKSLTDYPTCNLQQISQTYGHPNASVVIAGTPSTPAELLLFYDQGIHNSMAHRNPLPQTLSTVVPQTLDHLNVPACPTKTIINIVAHEDDDLLFMNPDLMHDIKAGNCVRTVYVTAGDAGAGKFYWLGREQGSEAAYDFMDGPSKDIWVQQTVKLSDEEFLTVVSPRGNPKISLLFMHLPDGNVNGSGFKVSKRESLARLEAGKVTSVQTVDGQSNYTSSQLKLALASLLHKYQPNEIRTQANYVSLEYPDHSDHMAVGRYVKSAYAAYIKQTPGSPLTPLKFYIGYPIHGFPENVSGDDFKEKEATFFQYGRFDDAVCRSIEECATSSAYSSYLGREYQNSY